MPGFPRTTAIGRETLPWPSPCAGPTVTDHDRLGITFDADLVDRARAGDRAAFATLYEVTLDAVTRYVAVRMRDRDRDAVGDLVHDAYCFALAEPTLIGDDPMGSMLRLAARAVTRHRWSHRRYLRAALTVGEDQHSGPTRTRSDRPRRRWASR